MNRAIEAAMDAVHWECERAASLDADTGPLTAALVALLYAADPEPYTTVANLTSVMQHDTWRTRQALREEAMRLMGAYDADR